MKKLKNLSNRKRINIMFIAMYAILIIASVTIFYKSYSEFVTKSNIWDGTETASNFAGGDGSQASPYLISNPTELAYFRDRVDGGTTFAGNYFQLTNDLDMNGKSWNPIGTDTNSFRGVFNGAGHTISNLYISTSSSLPTSSIESWGLFATLGGGTDYAVVKNLVLDSVNVDVNYYGTTSNSTYYAMGFHIGTVAGTMYNTSEVSNVIVKNSNVTQDGTITLRTNYFEYFIGGLVGYTVNSSSSTTDPGVNHRYVIDNCAVNTDISVNNETYYSWLSGTRNYYAAQTAFGGIIGGIRGQAVYPTNTLYQGSIDSDVGFIGPTFGIVRGASTGLIGNNTVSNYATIWSGDNAGTVSNVSCSHNDYYVNGDFYTTNGYASNSLFGRVQGVNKGNYAATVDTMVDDFNTNSDDITWTYDATNGFGMKPRITGSIAENTTSYFTYTLNDFYDAGTYTTKWYVDGVETSVSGGVLYLKPSLSVDKEVKVVSKDSDGYYSVTMFTLPQIELNVAFSYNADTKALTAVYSGSALNYISANSLTKVWTAEDISGYNSSEIARDVMSIDTTSYDEGTDFTLTSTYEDYTFTASYTVGNKKVVYVDYNNGNNYNTCLTPNDPCETMQYAYNKLEANGTRGSNVVVVMGNYTDNSYFNSATGSTYAKKATITSVYKRTNYSGRLTFEGYNNGYKYLTEDTTFQYITLYGTTSSGWYGSSASQVYFYLQGHDLTMGEGVVMNGYANSNTNQGLITGTAPAFHIFGAWLQYDLSQLPANNRNRTQQILIKSGSYGRIIMGGSNGTVDSGTMRQTTSHNFIGSSMSDMYKSELTIDILNSTKNSNYAYDVNLVVGGSAWGNMYADVIQNFNHGNVGRVLGASIGDSSISLSNWNYPLNTFIGSATINVNGGTIKELYGGALGRNMNALSGSSSETCDSYFYGDVFVNVNGGTINGNIYGAGAGGVSGYNSASTDPYKNTYGIGVDTTVKITQNGGTINGNIYGGGYGYTEYLTANTIATDGGTLYGDSEILISGGVLNGNIYGAGRGYTSYNNRTALAQMYGNSKITINGNGTITGNIYGAGEGASGYANNAKMTGNPYIELSKDLSTNVFGGGNIAPLYGNPHVKIVSGTISGTVYGGGNVGAVTGASTVDIVGGVSNEVYGGGYSANITTTTVNLAGGTASSIYGGSNTSGDVTTSNVVTTAGETAYLFGGNNAGGTTNASNVTINGGTVTTAAYGGGNATGTNTSTVTLVSSTNKIPNVFAGGKSAAVTTTTTYINGINVGNVFGGSDSSGNVTTSTIRINSGTPEFVYGGNNSGGRTNETFVYSNGGTAGTIFGGGMQTATPTTNVVLQGGNANNIFGGSNTSGDVNISNVTTTSGTAGNIYGGNSRGGVVATTNVTVNGGSVTGSIYGGGEQAVVTTSNVILTTNSGLIGFIFGGGKAASVTTTNVTINGGHANYAFGGSNTNGDVTNSHLTMNAGIVSELYGGNNQGGCTTTSDVKVFGGTNTYVYGGNNEGGSTTNANTSVTGGNVSNAYGGGNAAITGQTAITINNATIGSVVYGGGNAAGVTNGTDVNIINSNINGSVFGGGNSGSVGTNTDVYFSNSGASGSVHAGGNGATAVVYGNTLLNIDKASNITGNVFGGGNAAPVGTTDTNNSTTSVNIVGGTIGGNVYGGANTSVIYGTSNVNIGFYAVNNNYLTVSNITINGTIFGGGEANASGSTTYDFKFISVTGGTNVTIDGRDYSTFIIRGSFFGSGNASSSSGQSHVTLRNYGTFADYKTNVSIQRADFVTIDKSAILLTGATDRNNSHSDHLFSLSRIGMLKLTNNSTLFMENGANLVSRFISAIKINTAEEKAAVTIDANGTVTRNSNNRLYAKEGVNINIATDESNTSFGEVSGMTFFGLFKYDEYDRIQTGVYNNSYATGTAVQGMDNLIFTKGCYVSGEHKANHDTSVDGFYSNYVPEGETNVIQKYIIPSPDDTTYYLWFIGEEVSEFTVELQASKFSTLGTKEQPLLSFSSPNTVFSITGFNYSGLADGVELVPSSQIPRIASNESDANNKFGLTIKSGSKGWMNQGTTEFYNDIPNHFSGNTDYYHENSTSISSLVFYLYHSKNITTEGDLGEAIISLIAVIPDPHDDLKKTIKKINIIVKMERRLINDNEYEGTLSPGKKYELFASDPVNITSKSTLSAYFSLFAISNRTIYRTGDHHVLVSNMAFPENTKITMVNIADQSNPEYYYYIVTGADVTAANNQIATEGEASYELNKFIRMGSTGATNNYDEASHNATYYDADTGYTQEEFIFMIDFLQSNITADRTAQLTFELRNVDDEIMVNVMSGALSGLNYNLYYNNDAYIDLDASLNKTTIYGGESANLTVNTNFVQSIINTNTVIDTNYYDKKLGLRITLYDANGNLLSGSSIMGISYEYNGNTYYPNLDGSTRINISERVANVSSRIQINSNKNTIATGTYTLHIESFGSPDGIYYGLTPSDSTEINIDIIDSLYGLKINTADNNIIMDHETGFNLDGTSTNMYTIDYSSGLVNPQITISLERRLYDEVGSLDYEAVDFSDYVTNTFEDSDIENEYLVTDEPTSIVTQYLYFKPDLPTGTYRIMFKLYDGRSFVGSAFKYLIIK